MNKLNDWLKVLLVHLGGGVMAVLCFGLHPVFKGMNNIYLWCAFSLLSLVYYNLMGIYLRKVKAYKPLVIYVGSYVILFLIAFIFKIKFGVLVIPSIVNTFLTGGTYVYLNVWRYIEDADKFLWEARDIIAFASFGATYLGMLISRLSYKLAKKEAVL